MNIVTYNPKDVLFTLGGSYITGWNSFTISREPSFLLRKGIRGKHTRIRTYDTSAMITISLPQTSEWNDIFSSIVTNDIASATGRCEITLKDLSGSSFFESREAYIVGFAEVSFDSTIATRNWTIQCLSTTTYNVGGNSKATTQLFDSAVAQLKGLFN